MISNAAVNREMKKGCSWFCNIPYNKRHTFLCNNYASKNTLRVHRTAYCLKRNTPAAKKALQRFDKV